MKIVLFAATGRAGKTILTELINRNYQVRAIVRDSTKFPHDLSKDIQLISSDFTQQEQIENIILDAEIIISAFGPSSNDPRYTTDINYTDRLVDFAKLLVKAVENTNKDQRMIIVGGAGPLFYSPGVTVINSGYWPKQYIPIASSYLKAFETLKESRTNWTYFSPSILIKPGKHTDKFHLGRDNLIIDSQGQSSISFEDYAVALVDEIENASYVIQRFTIGY